MAEQPADGGCLCGSVRFAAAGRPIWVTYCHCHDCRKASGAPVTIFVGFQKEQIEWRGRPPQTYRSSPGITRRFCGQCGTPLSYEDERLPGEIYLMLGSIDEPERFEPQRHGWVSQRLPWLHIADDLPRHDGNTKPR